MISLFRDLRIATKLLATVLPPVAVSVVVLFMVAEHWMRDQRLAEMEARVEAYAATQAALLTKSIWDFDDATIERLVGTAARMEEVTFIEVRETTGRVIAQRRDEWAGGPANAFRIELQLTHRSESRTYPVGWLVVEYIDGPLRRDLREYRLISGLALTVALLLVGGVTSLATNRFVGRPLDRLRLSLQNNARLVWTGRDELGSVVGAYNGLLAEVEQRTAELTVANETLRGERGKLLLAASVYENTIEGIVVTDACGSILSVNAAFTKITGYATEDVLGHGHDLLRSDDYEPSFYTAITRSLASTGHWEGEVWGRRKDGSRFLGWATISVIPGPEGTKDRRFLGVFNDITELRAKDEHIHHLAYHDALTGLPNRRLLQDRLAHAINVSRRSDQGIAVIFIDVDQFKTVNDSLSHEMGDRLLEGVAAMLKETVRSMDTVCRWGGDEFVVMIESCGDPQEVRQVADKLLRSVGGPLQLGAVSVHVTVSLGIALYPQDGLTASELMRNADAALAEAKAFGRNCVHFFDESMNQRIRQRLEIEADLRQAIEHGELELHYQPKFSISGRTLSGLEALVRWRHPEKGMVQPGDFIPLAEETGLVIPIGEWVLREACRQIKRWRAAGHEVVQVAVNLSARHVADPVLVDGICAIVDEEMVEAALIEIEVTETAVMKNPEQVSALLGRLRAKGFSIAVDDFGTGYSSLSYLGKLPITTLKIDRSFVTNVDQNPDDAEIVRTIAAMANALDLKLVAEGVETAGEMALLATAGCDVIQGYLISRPLPPEAVAEWLPVELKLNCNAEA